MRRLLSSDNNDEHLEQYTSMERAVICTMSWYERLERNEYQGQWEHEYMELCCWVNSRVRQWLLEDDWQVSIHYLPSPTQVETEFRLANIDACFDANRSSSLDLKEICTKGGGIFTDVA